jgi:CheY-like chemotaxis protein
MAKKTILIVDDDAVIRKQMSVKLKNSGYDVLIAVDGSEAVRVSRQRKPDMILLDVSFPPDVAHGGGVAWDGILIMEWLRRLDESRNIPIVVMTASNSPKIKDSALAKGAAGFFLKPIDAEELMAVIKKSIGEGEPPTPGPAKKA